MRPQLSTFDTLVASLSTEEAQTILEKIAKSMKIPSDIHVDTNSESVLESIQVKETLQVDGESFLIRFLLHLKSFFKSLPVESVYEQTLMNRIGKNLHRNYKQYINTKSGVFTQEFYGLLSELRKSQLFLTSLLSAYDTDKGGFYVLVSSFVAPDAYVKLMDVTNPFAGMVHNDESSTLRSELLKKIDEAFSLISDDDKKDMYQVARAVEWMRAFCDIPIDKVLLRFTVNVTAQLSCSVFSLSEEMSMLASVLKAAKKIPDAVLQALFLLIKQDKLNNKDGDMNTELAVFIEQAACALGAIKEFSLKIPTMQVAHYAAQSIKWEPLSFEGGEDWFLLFKGAWKKRFNEQWQRWSYEKKRMKLVAEMLALLKTGQLDSLPYRPWEDMWLTLKFKHEFPFILLSSFFSQLYSSAVQPVLKILLKEGKFYRRENLSEYTKAFTVLEKQQNSIGSFIARLSDEGDLGSSFAELNDAKPASLKRKNRLEVLMKDIESEAKQLIDSTQEAFRLLVALLNGFIEDNKNSTYAPLSNWLTIQGHNNAGFRNRVEEVKDILCQAMTILSNADRLEAGL